MRITRFAAVTAVVSQFLVSAAGAEPRPARLSSQSDRGKSPFTVDAGGLILVPVSLGSRPALRCVLDTGASRTIVTDKLAAALGLAPVARANVVSSAGTAMHELVKLPPMTVAGVTRDEVLATVLPAARMRTLSDDAACVIGHDFLSTQDYTIDYENRKFWWDSVNGPSNGEGEADTRTTRLPLQLSEGRYIVELTQSSQPGDAVRLVPDSGASDIVLFRQPNLPSLPLAPPLTPIRGMLNAATGTLRVSAMRLERLQVGGIELTGTPAFLVDRRTEARTGAQGLLPLRLFARVSFRNSEGLMVVTAR